MVLAEIQDTGMRVTRAPRFQSRFLAFDHRRVGPRGPLLPIPVLRWTRRRRKNGAMSPMPPGYEKKFADFLRMCAETKANGVDHILIATPNTLGDTYDEIIESL